VRVVETASVPRRPNLGSWTRRPPIRAPGIPRTAMIRELRYVIYVEPSPNFAPRVAWMYGKNALYKGYPSPMKAQTRVINEVENASLLVANRARTWVKLIFSSRRYRFAVASVLAPAPSGSQAWRSASVTFWCQQCTTQKMKLSHLRFDVFPFLLATSWTILTASSSLPFPMRYFGDS